LAVIAGLEASSRIARLHDDPGHEQAWSKAAAEVATAFERHFFHEDEGRYARMAYPQPDGDLHLDMTVDAALSGLFLFDEGRASQERTRQTMDAVEDRLRVRTAVGGLARYEGDRYCARHDARADLPGNPWILTSLWMADWHLLRSSDDDGLARADAWIAWAARQATDAGLLPEQLDARTGEHLSVRPLTWSHSTFLSTSIKRDRLASKLRARAKI
ncbi:MAG: glycoside hydrolase family 15 protein, partial [Planctomycetes bacterium]|nr:glycoside hydrolase family 15 protein [Planctomycetota bacterium]